MACNSGGRVPEKSWQFRSALVMAASLSSASEEVMRGYGSTGVAPEIDDPVAGIATLDPRGEALAGEQIDERRWQEGCEKNQAFLRVEPLDPLKDRRQRFLSPLQQRAHIETFEKQRHCSSVKGIQNPCRD